jgi:hypothetical protein
MGTVKEMRDTDAHRSAEASIECCYMLSRLYEPLHGVVELSQLKRSCLCQRVSVSVSVCEYESI